MKYSSTFVNIIPTMNKNGRLVFEEEEKEPEIVNIPIAP
jgi:hypothetical protein